jgi:basic membrane protein A
MPKTRSLLLLLTGLLVSACTVGVPGRPVAVPSPTRPKPAKPPLTLVLLTPGGTDPVSKKLIQATKDYTAKHKGKLTELVTTGNPQNDGPFLTRAVQQKPTVVITTTLAVDKLMPLVLQNVRQQFLVIGSCPGKTVPSNLTCTDTRDHEGVFLMGAEAGLLSSTGKVGAVVAVNNIPPLKRFSVPFGQGAAAGKPGTTYQEAVVGGNGFNEPARAGQAAASLAASHVMTSAFGGNPGVFQAAKSGGFGVFGMDEGDCAAGDGVVVDSLVAHPDIVINDVLDAIDAGQGGRLRSYGLKENALSLHSLEADVSSSKCTVAAKPEVIAQVRDLREKIVTGELTVADPANS